MLSCALLADCAEQFKPAPLPLIAPMGQLCTRPSDITDRSSARLLRKPVRDQAGGSRGQKLDRKPIKDITDQAVGDLACGHMASLEQVRKSFDVAPKQDTLHPAAHTMILACKR